MPSPTTETGTATTARPTWLARVGVASWSIVGVVAVVIISLFILATISEVGSVGGSDANRSGS